MNRRIHTNGCWPSWIKKAPVEYEACNWHDIQYWLWVLPRKEIDKKFLIKMLEEKPWAKRWAYFYYILVRIFGKFYYNK